MHVTWMLLFIKSKIHICAAARTHTLHSHVHKNEYCAHSVVLIFLLFSLYMSIQTPPADFILCRCSSSRLTCSHLIDLNRQLIHYILNEKSHAFYVFWISLVKCIRSTRFLAKLNWHMHNGKRLDWRLQFLEFTVQIEHNLLILNLNVYPPVNIFNQTQDRLREKERTEQNRRNEMKRN